MSEGREMEKKVASRLPSVNGKSVAADRQKENGRGNGANRFHKKGGNEPSPQHKPPPQKTKMFDKRSRSRKEWTGRREEVTQVQRAEFGSALPYGPKKMNLNHLINFTMAPREDSRGAGGGRSSVWRGRNNWGNTRHPRFNKEQFLQANCQFVVKVTGDYTVQSIDPDKLVDWELIEQVRIFSHEVPSCPICLYPPAAAKITRCGHIYCWPCILHYLALGDKTWRKCPICYESIHINDLKSVVAKETPTYTVGDTITMRLMKRDKGSIIVQPYDPVNNQPVQLYNIKDDTSSTCFAKLLIASTEEVQHAIIEPEMTSLEVQMAENKGDDLECSFIKEAIDQLKARETEVTGITKATAKTTALLQDLELASHNGEHETVAIQEHVASIPSVVYASAFSDEEADPEDEPIPAASLAFVVEEPEGALVPRRSSTQKDDDESSRSSTPEIKERRSSDDVDKERDEDKLPAESSPNKKRSFFFYQVEDGQHLYMHSINIRCLIKEYGSLDKCPPTIQARIVAVEHMSIDQSIRRRLNFLQHLPITCEFATCELELKSPLLSKSTLQTFAGEILKRMKTRDRKARDEKRQLRKTQTEENKKLGNDYGPRFSMNPSHFPSYNADAYNDGVTIPSTSDTPPESPVSSSVGSPVGSSIDEEFVNGQFSGGASGIAFENPAGYTSSPPSTVAGSWKSTGSSEADHNSAFPSFAQMLREGKSNPNQAWPKVVHANSSGGQHQVTRSRRGPDGSDDSENEDHVPVPRYGETFGDAIQAALDKAVTKKNGDDDHPSPTNKKGKKGRKKQQLLFSNAGPRFK